MVWLGGHAPSKIPCDQMTTLSSSQNINMFRHVCNLKVSCIRLFVHYLHSESSLFSVFRSVLNTCKRKQTLAFASLFVRFVACQRIKNNPPFLTNTCDKDFLLSF